ncbi:MAG: hypothetical protein HYW97_02510 [Candidatus Wildermuthbacteria bacterium]|nr:hypothetical protein [Candidatus Wildermuthbacteria bacterium]
MDKPATGTGVQVGKFVIWPDSDSGSRANHLRIEGSNGERLLLICEPPDFNGDWGSEGEYIRRKTFKRLTSQEAEALRYIGTNLPMGIAMFAEDSARTLKERVDKIGSDKLERVFVKIFKLCRKEARRVNRPLLLRWLPV